MLCCCGSTQKKLPESHRWPVVLDELRLSVNLQQSAKQIIQERFNKRKKTFKSAMIQGLMQSQRIILLERDNLDQLITEEELAQQGVTKESGFSGFNSAKGKIFCSLDISRAKPRVLQVEAFCQVVGIQSSKVLAVHSKAINIKAAQNKDKRVANTNRVKKLIKQVSFSTAEKLPNLIPVPQL